MTDIACSSTEPGEAHPESPCLYQYDSLEDKPDTIRLLKIDHDCGDKSESYPRQHKCGTDRCRLTCCEDFMVRMPRITLHNTRLGSSTKYKAISYAWGSADPVQQVDCGSKVLRVTQSCYDLLCTLRRQDSVSCGRSPCNPPNQHYWIDAICINQGFQEEDTSEQRSRRERSHQVAMMATIYEKADEVVVWPGHTGVGQHWPTLSDSLSSFYYGLMKACPEEIPLLRSLIRLPYFTRIWPLQEIALAQRCTILVGRREDIDIRSVLLMPNPSLYPSGGAIDSIELASIRSEYGRVTTLHRQLLEFFQSGSNRSNASPRLRTPSVSEILLHARGHQASEPRDKIFALYGVLQRLQAHLEAPNYLRSVEDVYIGASTAAIHNDRSLRIFEGLTGFSNFNLPSWIPDWSDHQHIAKVAEWTDHRASDPSEAQAFIKGRELFACGLLVDTVSQDHSTFAPTSLLVEGNTLTEEIVKPLRGSSNVCVKQYLDFLERLFLDIWENKNAKSKRDQIHCQMVKDRANKRMENPIVRILIGYRKSGEFTEGSLRNSVVLYADLCRRLDRKTLFQTKSGRLGIASMDTKIGDSILLLQGCNLPMVVRPEGNKWKLIAPAYLPADGIMDGKLWKPDGPFESFTFT